MADADTTSNSSSNATTRSRFESLKTHVLANRLDTALWLSRVLAIVFTIGYVLPIFGYVSLAYYHTLCRRIVLTVSICLFTAQQRANLLLQSADGQCGHQRTATAPAIAARSDYSRIPVPVAAGGLLPLSVLFADFPVRQSDDSDPVPGCAVCRAAFG